MGFIEGGGQKIEESNNVKSQEDNSYPSSIDQQRSDID
jgi:hypothetical protein